MRRRPSSNTDPGAAAASPFAGSSNAIPSADAGLDPRSAAKDEIMIDIKFPDGSVRQYDEGVTGQEVAASISKSLEKKALLAKLDGQLLDIKRPLPSGGALEIVTRDSADALEIIRHDTAHVLAEAVQELFPGTQVTIGPNVEDGFYYDFARETPFSTEDFAAIEKRMREIVDRDEPITREVWDRDEAIAHFEAIGEHYKAQIIRDLPETESISVYRQGEWKDLCRGPHLPSTRHVGKAFKLMKLAGAYWRGDQNNAQLQRVYGTAWASEAELEAYLKRLEEAEKRDHRKIGRAMDLFHFQEEAKGAAFWHPKGWTLYRAVENYVRRRTEQAGYVEVNTPQILDRSLWERSGSLGQVPRQHVHLGDRGGRGAGGQADELPVPRSDLQPGPEVLPRAADPHDGVRRPAPVRELRIAAWAAPCTEDGPGRRPHLLHARTRSRRSRRPSSSCWRRSTPTSGVELHSVKLALRPEQRFGTDETVDGGRGHAGAGRQRRRGSKSSASRTRAPSMVPSSSSTCATPSAAPGSAARCSSTMSCPSASTPNTWATTARSTAR